MKQGNGHDVPDRLVLDELARVLASPGFAGSEKLRAFLQFIVERKLDGTASELKEYVIAVEVYGREPSFDPRTDSIVRTEAIRLRKRLEEYYATTGFNNSLRIRLARGTYIPEFEVPNRNNAMPGQDSIPGESSSSGTPVDSARLRSPARLREHAGLLLLFGLSLLAVGFFLLVGDSPAPTFGERDWVLIAKFENRTGDPMIDDTFEQAISMELTNSSFVNVVPVPRLEHVLELMKRERDTLLSRQVAREVAIRDGQIRLIVAGRADRVGNDLQLSLELIDPDSDRSIAGKTLTASGFEEVLPSFHQLSDWVRETLGETLKETNRRGRPLDSVTTSSLKALYLYTRGNELLKDGRVAAAEALFRQAIEEDQQFASAHIMLAWCIRNSGRSTPFELIPHWEAARTFSQHADERERLFILGSGHAMLAQYGSATAYFEALVRLDPDDYWATRNLIRCYDWTSSPSHSAHLKVRLADITSAGFWENWQAAFASTFDLDEPERGKFYLQRARALADELGEPDTVFQGFRAQQAWVSGDVAELLKTVKSMAASSPKGPYLPLAVFAGAPSLGLGMLEQAERLIHQHLGVNGPRWLPWVEEARGNQTGFREKAEELRRQWPNALSAIVLCRAGYLEEARSWIELSPPEPLWEAARGEYLLAQGRENEALLAFETARGLAAGVPEYLIAVNSMAGILEKNGELARARDLLRESTAIRHLAYPESVYFWVVCQSHLLQIHQKLGEISEVEDLRLRLLQLLRDADADFEPLRILKNSEPAGDAPPEREA